MKELHWEKKIKGLLKAEIVKRNLSRQDLIDRLRTVGVDTTQASLNNKLSRGSFSAVFLIQCLTAIECNELKIK